MFDKRSILLVATVIVLSGCCSSSPGCKDEDIIVKINNYSITRDEFESEFKASPNGKTDTPESRRDFLDTLINRKLILQYAQKEGLDKEANFLKTIEKFWEQSLLRVALDKKTAEIETRLSASGWKAKRDEEADMVSDWVDGLRKEAHITINDGILSGAADKDGGNDMYKRKNYFIDKKFQTNFILRFCMLVVVTGGFIMAVLYALSNKATTVSFVNSRVVVQGTSDFLVPILIQTFVVSTILVGIATIIITLFVSHRIAGPLYRFKKVLSSLSEGDFSLACKIRLKDSLQDVASAFNDMIIKVRKNFEIIDKDLKHLKGKMDAGDLKEIKKSVSEVDKAFHNFKF